MKVYFLMIVVFLAGCGGGNPESNTLPEKPAEVPEKPIVYLDDIYIVSGQSNATVCDWSYFEELTGHEVVNIAIGGRTIDMLIDEYKTHNLADIKPKGIMFVHGENDSIKKTDVDYYVERVEFYREMISKDLSVDLPLYISTVGYYVESYDEDFDRLRNKVISQSKINKMWHIAYNDAQYYRYWGLLYDGIHFDTQGCNLMMEGIASYI